MYTPEYIQYLKTLAVGNSIFIFRNKDIENKVVMGIETITNLKLRAIKVCDVLPNTYIYFDLQNGLKIDYCPVCSKKFKAYNNNIYIHHPLRLVT